MQVRQLRFRETVEAKLTFLDSNAGMAAISDTSMTRALAQAAHVVGGVEALAEKLGVTAAMLQGWLAGASEAPAGIYVRALDILISAAKK